MVYKGVIMKFISKKNGIRILIALAVFGVVLLVARLYAVSVSNMLEKNNKSLLSELSDQCNNLILEKIDNNFTSLEVLADAIANSEDLFSEQNQKMTQQYAEKNQSVRILISDMAGNLKASDGIRTKNHKDIVDEVKKNGGRTVSEVTVSEVDDGLEIIAISVPLYRNDVMVGTVTCVDDMSQYSDLMSFPLFEGNAYHYVLHSTGEAVTLPEDGSLPFDFATDVSFEQGDFFKDVKALKKLPDEMAQGNSGMIDVKGKIAAYINYQPLGINDWYLLSVIPDHLFSHQTRSITGMMLLVNLFVGLLIVGLASFAVLSYRSKNKMMHYFAYVDRLTQLPNYQSVMDFYEKLPQAGKSYSYVLFHIDNFQMLNRILGYVSGSTQLKKIATALQEFVKPGEIAGRIREDNFVLLIKESNRRQCSERLKNLFDTLQKIQVTDGEITYNYNCIYSCIVYPLGSEIHFDKLSEQAVWALKKQKNDKRVNVHYFDQNLKNKLELQNELVADVCQAIRNHEFALYFQLQYDTSTNEFVGGEIFPRWKHPQKGIIVPEDFISVLETAGLALELDMIMLEEACKKLRSWIDRGLMPIPLSINISRLNIHRTDFVQRIKQIVQHYKISPALLTLELAETAIYVDTERVIGMIHTLKDYGFTLSIDNFDLGYSSLNMLRQASVDMIKLNQAFFSKGGMDQKDTIVLQNIINTIKLLDIQIVAEGIQTQQQADFLNKIGCNIIQGTLYSKLMPEEEFEKMVFTE